MRRVIRHIRNACVYNNIKLDPHLRRTGIFGDIYQELLNETEQGDFLRSLQLSVITTHFIDALKGRPERT